MSLWNDRFYHLIGIIALGKKCGNNHHPGILTKVESMYFMTPYAFALLPPFGRKIISHLLLKMHQISY